MIGKELLLTCKRKESKVAKLLFTQLFRPYVDINTASPSSVLTELTAQSTTISSWMHPSMANLPEHLLCAMCRARSWDPEGQTAHHTQFLSSGCSQSGIGNPMYSADNRQEASEMAVSTTAVWAPQLHAEETLIGSSKDDLDFKGGEERTF